MILPGAVHAVQPLVGCVESCRCCMVTPELEILIMHDLLLLQHTETTYNAGRHP